MSSSPVFRLALVSALALAAGCNALGNQITAAPYKQGLRWTATEAATSTLMSFKATPANGEVESTGTLGFGSTCGNALASTGTLTATTVEDMAWTNLVLGNTVADHPLNPGNDVFSQIGVSVVSEQSTSTGSNQTNETFFRPDAEPGQREWTETAAGDAGRTTSARFHGVAADEYIVSLFPLDLWDPTDNYVGVGRAESGDRRLTLLSRHNPPAGATWQSLDGGTIYVFDGTEKLNVGGKTVTADRVAVFANENVDTTDVLSTCLQVGPFEDTTTFPEGSSTLTEAVVLDSGCEGSYQSLQVGTEWWYDDVLVKFEGTRTFVEITDFGWEWTVDGEGGCERFTSTTKPAETGITSNLFVEYTVTTRDSLYSVDSWEVSDVVPDAGE